MASRLQAMSVFSYVSFRIYVAGTDKKPHRMTPLSFGVFFIRSKDLIKFSQTQSLWAHSSLEFEIVTDVQSFSTQCLTNLFSVLLSRIASQEPRPDCSPDRRASLSHRLGGGGEDDPRTRFLPGGVGEAVKKLPLILVCQSANLNMRSRARCSHRHIRL